MRAGGQGGWHFPGGRTSFADLQLETGGGAIHAQLRVLDHTGTEPQKDSFEHFGEYDLVLPRMARSARTPRVSRTTSSIMSF